MLSVTYRNFLRNSTRPSQPTTGFLSSPLPCPIHQNRARDISRQLRASYPTSGINVVLAPGTYDLSSNALELQAAALDGGASPAAPIHYFAAAPNTVTLSGGRTLSGWRPSQRFPGAPANSSLSTCPTSAQPADNCGYPYSAEYDCVERGCCWAPGGVQPSGSWCNYRTAHTRYAAWELPVQASQVRHLIVNGRAALRPRITDPVQLYGMNPNGFFSNSSEVRGRFLLWNLSITSASCRLMLLIRWPTGHP